MEQFSFYPGAYMECSERSEMRDQAPAPGAVAPLALPTGAILWVSVARRRRPGEARGGAATS
ncbi:hypothetical protein INR49_026317, partial [Caranx melampygus]